MKNIFIKLSLISVLTISSLSLTGCATSMGNSETPNGVIKYSEVLENCSTEQNYTKIINQITSKSKISERDLFKILKSNYYENSLEKNNQNKKLENEKIVKLYSKKYLNNNKILNKTDPIIIHNVINEALKTNINYEELDEFVLNKIKPSISNNNSLEKQTTLNVN